MNTWSSIVQKSIPIDYAKRMEEKHIHIVIVDNQNTMNTTVNDRDIPVEFHENEIGSQERKGEKKFYRMRKVPKAKNKDYTTKPKNKSKKNNITEKVKLIHSIVHGN